MATSTIFNFNFNNSEIVDSTGQWYNATTGTPTTEFIEHDGNTALFQPALTNGDRITPNPTMLRSYDPNFKAYTYTLEVQVCAVLNRTSNSSFILNFPIGIDAGDVASALGLWYNDPGRLEMWIDYASEGPIIHPVLIDFSTAGFDRWFSIRIERTVDPNNPYIGATVKAYVDGAEIYNQTFTYAQSTIRGMIGPRLRYCENLYATGGVAIDNLKLTAGIAPSRVVDVSLANLQRNNANLLSFIKGKVPTVNDGTLTIQKNGTNVATFTANQSTNATANIQCVDLTSAQTVAGNKEFTGTTTAHDVVPSATDTYNFGSPSYQWNNAYIKSLTINGVVAGDILTHNASEFVGVTGAQTIDGTKTFSSSPRVTKVFPDIALNISDCDVTELPTEAKFASLFFRDKNNKNLAYIASQQRIDGTKRMCFRTHRTNNIDSYYSVDLDSNGDFYPEQNNAINLGNSTYKWKTINGLNPGALSLPGNYINVDTTNWVLDGSDVNSFIPASDGWLGIQVTDTVYDQMHYVFVGRTGGGSAYYQQNLISPINALWDSKYYGCVFIPVIKNINYDIRCICSSITATFYPCQGNV